MDKESRGYQSIIQPLSTLREYIGRGPCFFVSLYLTPIPPLPSACHTERRKTRRKVAMRHIAAVKAECPGVGTKEDDRKKRGPPPILYSIYDLADRLHVL